MKMLNKLPIVSLSCRILQSCLKHNLVRCTTHPDTRKEILKRLLLLNHRRHAEEVAAGWVDDAGTVTSKGKEELRRRQQAAGIEEPEKKAGKR